MEEICRKLGAWLGASYFDADRYKSKQIIKQVR